MLNQMFPRPRRELFPRRKRITHLIQMRIIMGSNTTTKTVSVLRDRWRHNRKLMDTVRNPKPQPTGVPAEHAQGWEKLEEFPQQKITKKSSVADKR